MKKKGKVLVVEDNKKWAKDIEKLLTENGFFVKVISNLDKALDILGKEYFHFATIDLQLDESTLIEEDFEGWQVMSKIVKIGENRTMPIMVLTGFPGEDNRNNKLKALTDYKALFFMEKSKFDKHEFIEKITRIVDQSDLRFKDDHREGA